MNPWKGLGALPKESWILFVTALVNRAGTMVLPFLVLYLTESMGLSPGEASLAVAAYGVGAMICGPPSGHLADRVGGLTVMRASLFGSGLMILLMMFVKSFTAILAGCLLWGIVSESLRPANLMLLTSIVTPDQRKAAVALNRLAINLGMSLGPAAGGFLAVISFKWLFVVDAATCFAAFAVLAFSTWGANKSAASPSQATGPMAPSDLENKKKNSMGPEGRALAYFLCALLPSLLVFFQTQAAMPFYLVREM